MVDWVWGISSRQKLKWRPSFWLWVVVHLPRGGAGFRQGWVWDTNKISLSPLIHGPSLPLAQCIFWLLRLLSFLMISHPTPWPLSSLTSLLLTIFFSTHWIHPHECSHPRPFLYQELHHLLSIQLTHAASHSSNPICWPSTIPPSITPFTSSHPFPSWTP